MHDKFNPIYLHLESDSFGKDLMLPSEINESTFESVRMVPPGI
jgi:hypothetical protein